MKRKNIILITFVLLALVVLVFLNTKKDTLTNTHTSPQKNGKNFIMDESRHLDKKTFHSLIHQRNTQVLNISTNISPIFSEHEITLSNPLPKEKELIKLDNTKIYLAYCGEKICSNDLFELFNKHGLALYDEKK